MFARLVRESIARNLRRKLITAAALVVGMAVATATFTVALDVGDQLAREFRSLGANLLVTPKSDSLPLEIGGVDYRPVNEGAYLSVADLPKLKMIFWRHNILGFTPFLDVPVEVQELDRPRHSELATLIGTWYAHTLAIGDGATFTTGASLTHPWWKIEGKWFADGAKECVVGASFAEKEGIKPGETLELRAGNQMTILTVTGILSTGGPQDGAIVAPLSVVQELAVRPGQFRQLLVSALTKPPDALAGKDPNTMTAEEFDRWYCSPYVTSIAHQIQQVLPGTEVRPIRRLAETEGRILSRVSALFWIVTLAALAAAALAVAATSATTVLERETEVGLMKALGASNFHVSMLFLSEQLLLALVGGGVGFLFGAGLAHTLGESVFGVPTLPRLVVLPVSLVLAILVSLAGCWIPLRRAAHFQPAAVLRDE